MLPAGTAMLSSTPEAEDFVRYCYKRRRVGWPELYDEMCAVATRGLYQGMDADALAEIGVGFSLFETPRLAQIVRRVAAEEQAARKAAKATCPTGVPVMAEPATGEDDGAEEPAGAPLAVVPAA